MQGSALGTGDKITTVVAIVMNYMYAVSRDN